MKIFPKSTWMTSSLIVSVVMGLILWACLMFRWHIMDVLNPFIGGSLIGVVWLIAVLIFVQLCRDCYLNDEKRDFLPLLVLMMALIMGVVAPFARWGLYVNFYVKKSSREQVISSIQSNHLKINFEEGTKLVTLPKTVGVLVAGDEMVVENSQSNEFFLFFTERGFFGVYSGFLWVSTGAKPQQFQDLSGPGVEIEAVDEHWYFVSHR